MPTTEFGLDRDKRNHLVGAIHAEAKRTPTPQQEGANKFRLRSLHDAKTMVMGAGVIVGGAVAVVVFVLSLDRRVRGVFQRVSAAFKMRMCVVLSTSHGGGGG